MNPGKSIHPETAAWRAATVEKEVSIRPRRPALAGLRTGDPLSRIKAAFRPSGLNPIDLDFHPRRLSGPGLGFLAAGLLLAAAALAEYGNVADDVQHWRSELARLQQSPQGRQASRQPGDEAALQQASQVANTVARDIRRPWEALFTAIEAAQSDDVALLSLSPDPVRGVVRITGEARRREAILDYIERLGQGNVLANVVLVEDQLQQQDPEKPFRFMLSADWRMPS